MNLGKSWITRSEKSNIDVFFAVEGCITGKLWQPDVQKLKINVKLK